MAPFSSNIAAVECPDEILVTGCIGTAIPSGLSDSKDRDVGWATSTAGGGIGVEDDECAFGTKTAAFTLSDDTAFGVMMRGAGVAC